MSDTKLKIVVLYADVSGSTRLYETFGDAIAAADINSCLELLTEVVVKHGGKRIKTIGDEIMCLFYKARACAEASIEMNQVLRDASKNGHFQSGELHVKMGWHFGTGAFRADDIIGEAPLLAQQMINMAKPDEILTSQRSVDELPAELKATAIFIDRVEAEDGSAQLDVFSLPWNEDDLDATVVGSALPDETSEQADVALTLRYRDQVFNMSTTRTHCHIGRGEDNELVVYGEYTSRHHGEIYYRHGRFHLADMSTNGTGVIQEGDDFTRLHREETMLHGRGTLCFGGEPKTDPGAAVEYECIKADN